MSNDADATANMPSNSINCGGKFGAFELSICMIFVKQLDNFSNFNTVMRFSCIN
jgi:hypothetical protein